MDHQQPRVAAVTLTLLRRAEHVLFVALLLVGAVRAARSGRPPVGLLITAVAAVALWYVLGVVLARHARRPAVAGLWFAGLTAGWIGLATLSVDFVWLAFALFLLAMQVLPRALGPVVVAGLAAVAIAAFSLHEGRLSLPAVLGPVIGAGVAIVIMTVYRDLRQQNELTARLLADLTAAQGQLAAAQRRAGTLAERERLAGEIHDTVAQSLSTIILLVKSTAGRWPDAPVAARRHLDAAVEAALSALEDTRRLIRALTPAPLAGRPLTEALGHLVDGSRRLGLDARVTVDGLPYPLPTPVEVALLRVGQEAIANVRAHAAADRVDLTLTFLPGAVSLDVVDNGRGFDPDQPLTSTTGTGLGLATMRRRLAAVGGALVVESAPGQGSAISASVPTEGETS
ncbi:sensor histidine kinase [Micromonospora soli]|uniref:sensor histidine kinase n=1 Tax=Micromonospora sp. NBRC 110009 TaxID=3061627 RepID=UPI0026731476|nr:sensor histidine kinase [Micromonospora sp. NBRC 110009]WKT97635.1 sensor histidine kinase [Micromonospora sp. NBRC 110009]